MPNKLTVTINKEDEKRFIAKMKGLKATPQMVDNTINRVANDVIAEMKSEVPYRTGNLKRNIDKVYHGKGKLTIFSRALSNLVSGYDYAPIIEEYGGRFSKGIYYFSKGISRFRTRVKDEILTGIRTIANSNGRGAIRQQGKVRTFTPRK